MYPALSAKIISLIPAGIMSDAEQEDEERTPKKLRSGAEPDLRVYVGSDRQLFHHHSLTLATHSDYVDALLASSMAESEARQLSFPDIAPRLWQKMLSFLEDPGAARRITIEDAQLVLPLYDKYQFRKGKRFCVDVLSEFIQSMDDKANLGQLVDVVLSVTADQDNLEATKNIGIDALVHRFSQRSRSGS